MQLQNPQKQKQKISKKVCASATAFIVGNDAIEDQVLIAPNATIRAGFNSKIGADTLILHNSTLYDVKFPSEEA